MREILALLCSFLHWLKQARSKQVSLWTMETLHQMEKEANCFALELKKYPSFSGQLLKERLCKALSLLWICLNAHGIEAIGGSEERMLLSPLTCLQFFLFVNPFLPSDLMKHLESVMGKDLEKCIGLYFISMELVQTDCVSQSATAKLSQIQLEECSLGEICEYVLPILDENCVEYLKKVLQMFYLDSGCLQYLESLLLLDSRLVHCSFEFLASSLPNILIACYFEEAEQFEKHFQVFANFIWKAFNYKEPLTKYIAKMHDSLDGIIDRKYVDLLPKIK